MQTYTYTQLPRKQTHTYIYTQTYIRTYTHTWNYDSNTHTSKVRQLSIVVTLDCNHKNKQPQFTEATVHAIT